MKLKQPMAIVTFILSFLISLLITACQTPLSSQTHSSDTLTVQILALNDFHGALLPPNNGSIGGIAHIATLIKQLRAENVNTIVVGSGDLVGGSPLLSAMFNDEPTITALNAIGMDVSVVGNHEFDKGKSELLRKQFGGCHPKTGCLANQPFNGAKFQYLAANVINQDTGKSLFPEYYIKHIAGVDIAFIGVVLEGAPTIISRSGTNGLVFQNEVQHINRLVKQLRQQGIKNIGVLLHEGASQSPSANDINGCEGISGKAISILNQLDSAVDFVLSGHTHKFYNCVVNHIPLISGQSNGVILSQLLLSIDKKNHQIINIIATNILVDDNKYPADKSMTELIHHYQVQSDQIANRILGQLSGDLPRDLSHDGDSLLGKVVTDAQLYAASASNQGAAQIALTNSGGIRAPLMAGQISYNDIYTVQPFSNQLVTKTLTGQQIKNLLEQQWQADRTRIMAVSHGFYYQWDDSKPMGSKVVASSMKLNNRKLDMQAKYRVVANEFLAEGGDNFTEFTKGTHPIYSSVLDNESLMKYVQKHSPLAVPSDSRIKRIR